MHHTLDELAVLIPGIEFRARMNKRLDNEDVRERCTRNVFRFRYTWPSLDQIHSLFTFRADLSSFFFCVRSILRLS